MFQIGHVSLTSADTYRRDSYCLARVFQNLPAPPKQYGVFDVFAILKVFSNLKTWGRTWQCTPMTDFYRKVNKFFQKFAKCDPWLLRDKHCALFQSSLKVNRMLITRLICIQ